MPELRRDPVVGYWTIISTERGRRPLEFKPTHVGLEPDCPYCLKKNVSDAQVRVVLSQTPLLRDREELERRGEGLYDLMNGIGRHEIIIESQKHNTEIDELSIPQIQEVISTYASRISEMEKDQRLKYALLFKDHGQMTGSSKDSVRHSRSQLIGMPIIPKRVKEELVATKMYFDRRDRCVFCDILRQEESEGVRVVTQNKSFFAFCPFASRSPFEVWILPKKHCADFDKLDPGDTEDFALILKECLQKIRVLLKDPPYNTILHTAPYRHRKKDIYWKTIEEDYHWYLLISPRLTHSAGFEWGTGIHINPTPPEDAALLLREADAPTT